MHWEPTVLFPSAPVANALGAIVSEISATATVEIHQEGNLETPDVYFPLKARYKLQFRGLPGNRRGS